jgi:hypothetical protein
MMPAGSNVYFQSPGIASVTRDEAGQLVMVEREGWADSAESANLLDAEIHHLPLTGVPHGCPPGVGVVNDSIEGLCPQPGRS